MRMRCGFIGCPCVAARARCEPPQRGGRRRRAGCWSQQQFPRVPGRSNSCRPHRRNSTRPYASTWRRPVHAQRSCAAGACSRHTRPGLLSTSARSRPVCHARSAGVPRTVRASAGATATRGTQLGRGARLAAGRYSLRVRSALRAPCAWRAPWRTKFRCMRSWCAPLPRVAAHQPRCVRQQTESRFFHAGGAMPQLPQRARRQPVGVLLQPGCARALRRRCVAPARVDGTPGPAEPELRAVRRRVGRGCGREGRRTVVHVRARRIQVWRARRAPANATRAPKQGFRGYASRRHAQLLPRRQVPPVQAGGGPPLHQHARVAA